MALDPGIIERGTQLLLENNKPPDILGQYQKMQALRTMQLQQQDIASQVQERNAKAARDQADVQRASESAQSLMDWHTANPGADMTDPKNIEAAATSVKDPKMSDSIRQSYTEAATRRQTNATAAQVAATGAAAQTETANKNLFEQQQAKAKQAKENAEEAAGTMIVGSEFTTPDATGKPSRAAQFRVRQPDGSYTNETRVLGQQVAPPQNPPQPQAPMSQERFNQELRLEAVKGANSGNAIPPLDFLTEQSSTGVPFIDASKVEPKTLNALQSAAGAAGKKVVDKDTAQGLRDIKTAKDNQQSMMDMLNGKLADNPVSRLFVAPENKLKQIGQIDPNLAATGTFLGPAIANLRAVAGAKNFRITKAEIDAAMQNFVPLATDTIDTARAKMAALGHFMDNKERAALGTGPSSSGFTLQYQGKTLSFPDQKSLDAAKAAIGIK